MWYRGRVELVKLPENRLKALAEIKKKFTLNLSISEFVKNTEKLPYIIDENMYDREYHRIVDDSSISDYVKFVAKEEVHGASWIGWGGYKNEMYDGDGDNEEDGEEDDDMVTVDPQSVVALAEMLTEIQELEENCGESEIADERNNEHKSEHNNESKSECKSVCESVRKAVLDEVTKCVYHTQEYLIEHKEQYLDRGLLEDNEEDIGTLWLCGLVDILSEYQYVCELDWKTELEDFIYFVEALRGVLARGLRIDPQWLSEEADISERCKVLLEKWGRADLCFASIDMESDSYVIFPYNTTKLPELKICAQRAGFRIDLVENV